MWSGYILQAVCHMPGSYRMIQTRLQGRQQEVLWNLLMQSFQDSFFPRPNQCYDFLEMKAGYQYWKDQDVFSSLPGWYPGHPLIVETAWDRIDRLSG